MADFTVEIAGCTAAVHSLFDSTRDYCRDYLTQAPPRCAIRITPDDLLREQRLADLEAEQEGFRRRKFTDPFLERAAMLRAFAAFALTQGVILTHGSAIAVDGRGYLFLARSGTGKSTHTRLWRELLGHRARMINDDHPFLCPTQEGYDLCGSPWSGKHGLHSPIRMPLAGICLLERGAENAIAPLSPRQALPGLAGHCLCPEPMLQKIASATPLWHLTCNREPTAAQMAFAAMSGENIQKDGTP